MGSLAFGTRPFRPDVFHYRHWSGNGMWYAIIAPAIEVLKRELGADRLLVLLKQKKWSDKELRVFREACKMPLNDGGPWLDPTQEFVAYRIEEFCRVINDHRPDIIESLKTPVVPVVVLDPVVGPVPSASSEAKEPEEPPESDKPEEKGTEDFDDKKNTSVQSKKHQRKLWQPKTPVV